MTKQIRTLSEMLSEIDLNAVPKTDGYTLDFSPYLIRGEDNVLREAAYYFDGRGRLLGDSLQKYVMIDGPQIIDNEEGLIELKFEYTGDQVSEYFGTDGSLFFETERDLIKYLRRQI